MYSESGRPNLLFQRLIMTGSGLATTLLMCIEYTSKTYWLLNLALSGFALIILIWAKGWNPWFMIQSAFKLKKLQSAYVFGFSFAITVNLLTFFHNLYRSTIVQLLSGANVSPFGQFLVQMMLYTTLGLAALPFILSICLTIYQKLFPSLLGFYHSIDREEKWFFTILSVIAVIFTAVLFNLTNVFYGAKDSLGEYLRYDLIFTSDSAYQASHTDVYLNPSAPANDIRQPLFGLFAMPFILLAKVLSKLFFFIPNSYLILSNSLQIVILGLSTVMLIRLAGFKGPAKWMSLILMTSTYSFIVFSFVMEQYIFATFWLVLFLYSCQKTDCCQEWLYLAATGSLMTSIVVLPFSLSGHSIRQKFKSFGILTLNALSLILITGRLPLLIEITTYLEKYGKYTGVDVPLQQQLLQYINLIGGSIVRPATVICLNSMNHWSYQLSESHTVNPVGIMVLTLALLGFFLNKNLVIARISLAWLVFSAILLGLIGWGTAENGLILYSLYFAWAWSLLCILALDRMIRNYPTLKIWFFLSLAILLYCLNISGLLDMVRFGIQYYPN